jgi:hypothetical protein
LCRVCSTQKWFLPNQANIVIDESEQINDLVNDVGAHVDAETLYRRVNDELAVVKLNGIIPPGL